MWLSFRIFMIRARPTIRAVTFGLKFMAVWSLAIGAVLGLAGTAIRLYPLTTTVVFFTALIFFVAWAIGAESMRTNRLYKS